MNLPMNGQTENLSKGEQERLERLKASRMGTLRRSIIWFVIVGLIVAGTYWIIDYSRKAEGDKPGEAIADQGAQHIAIGAEHEPYNSNPPTSGPHYAEPAKWGIYEESLADEQLIHNLEHGGIWISYRDATDQDLIAKLKDVASDYTVKLIMTPRSENDSAIAVAAWGRLLKLDSFDQRQIQDFIKTFINQGPEQVPF